MAHLLVELQGAFEVRARGNIVAELDVQSTNLVLQSCEEQRLILQLRIQTLGTTRQQFLGGDVATLRLLWVVRIEQAAQKFLHRLRKTSFLPRTLRLPEGDAQSCAQRERYGAACDDGDLIAMDEATDAIAKRRAPRLDRKVGAPAGEVGAHGLGALVSFGSALAQCLAADGFQIAREHAA